MNKAIRAFRAKLLSSELAISGLAALLMSLLGGLGAFFNSAAIARTLGAEQAGLYFLCFSLVTILAALARVGTDSSIVRFVGERVENLWSVLGKVLCMTILMSSLFALLISFLSVEIASSIFSQEEIAPVLKAIAPSIVGVTIYTAFGFALQGIRRAAESVLVLNICCNYGMILWLYVVPARSAIEVASIFSVLTCLSVSVGLILLRFKAPVLTQGVLPWRRLLESCLPLWMVVAMAQVVQWSGHLIAGAYLEPEQVAMFAVALRTATLTAFLLTVVNMVVAPRYSRYIADGNFLALERLVKHSIRAISVVAVPVVAMMWVFPAWLLGLFGEEFHEGADLLRILALGQLVNALTGSVGVLLMMSGNERDMRNITVVSGVMALGLTWVLVASYGVLGAALGTAIAVAAQNLLAVHFVNKRLKINTLKVWL